MASLRMKYLILLVLVLMSVAMLKGCEAYIWHGHTTVEIINNLTHPQDLTLHCKSKTDDKGEHTLKNGEAYQFGFQPNIFLTVTLYFCNFRWPSDPSYHYFDIYVQSRDEDECKKCSWRIWEGGACRYDRVVGYYSMCHPWNPKPLTPLAVAPSIATNSSGL